MADANDRMTLIIELGAMAKQAERRGDNPSADTLRATIEQLVRDHVSIERRSPSSVVVENRVVDRAGARGYVYYIRNAEMIKIGFSKNPWARLSSLRTSAPDAELVALEAGSIELEARRHLDFAHLRQKREWFRREADLAHHIQLLVASTSTTSSSTSLPISQGSPRPLPNSLTTTAQSSSPATAPEPACEPARAFAWTPGREATIAALLTTDAGRNALSIALASASFKSAVVAEIDACLQGTRGAQHVPTAAQLDVALSDYVANGLSRGEKWNADHFRGCLRRAIRGESSRPPSSTGARPGLGQRAHDTALAAIEDL